MANSDQIDTPQDFPSGGLPWAVMVADVERRQQQ